MRVRLIVLATLALASMLLATLSVSASQAEPESVSIPITDSRTGDGPCGFEIERDLQGSVRVTPVLDERGNLVLTIDDVDLYGTLTNPANGKSVEIQWVRQNGTVAFEVGDGTTNILLQLTGTLNRGYDTADADLTMDLPLDGTDPIAFVAEGHNADAWAQACASLS